MQYIARYSRLRKYILPSTLRKQNSLHFSFPPAFVNILSSHTSFHFTDSINSYCYIISSILFDVAMELLFSNKDTSKTRFFEFHGGNEDFEYLLGDKVGINNYAVDIYYFHSFLGG